MKISSTDLKKISREFLTVLEAENIQTVGDLDSRVGTSVLINDSEKYKSHVSFARKDSIHDTFAYVVSYNSPDYGMALEVKINTALKYSKVILKLDGVLNGYKPYFTDRIGNRFQMKRIDCFCPKEVMKELRKLESIL
ncbi:MAG: hypothetical protein AABW81_03115 [Nanoarchaeota archaeon]